MIDVIVYKPLGFIIYHIKHERVYVSFKYLTVKYI